MDSLSGFPEQMPSARGQFLRVYLKRPAEKQQSLIPCRRGRTWELMLHERFRHRPGVRAVSYGGNAMGVRAPTALPTLPLPPSPKQPARSAGTTEGWG